MKNKYILYAGGELGRNTLSKLQANNNEVICFLDKKAKGVFENVKILMPDTDELDNKIKEESIVVICLNAGMLHKEVAEELYALGFEKIVFLPMEYSINYEEKIELTNLYNRALKGEDIGDKVKPYAVYRENKYKDSATIRCEDGWRLIWVGQEILFSENKLEWSGDRSKIHMINDGIDVNLNVYYWFHNLFDYLDGDREECDSYLSIFKLEANTEAAIRKLQDRERLYSVLKKHRANGLGFFIEAASEAKWNKKGYFNIAGGNHRTICLQHLGYVYYPVKINENDYKIWKNENCLHEVIEYIKNENIGQTYVPIPHPCFKDFPYQREEGGKTILGDILRYLGPIRLDGMKVVDASQYEGYFARATKRMCADKVMFYSNEEKVRGLAEQLFKLLYVESIEMIDNVDGLRIECEKADILFGMLNTPMLLEMNCLKNFSGKLFSEFYIEDSSFIELILKNTKMNQYTSLQRKVFQGKMLEVGVFEV